MPLSAVQQFIRAINTRDLKAMDACLSRDHVFTDAYGATIAGASAVVQAWERYFALFPDYRIEIEEVYGNGDFVAVFGYASGTRAGGTADGASWRLPAAWKARAEGGLVASWQVYADTKVPFDILHEAPTE